MHLSELLAARSRAAAGVYLMLTRRCPLSCAHCSTDSGATSPTGDPALFRRFADTMTTADRPDFVLLTGGEPLLAPTLVIDLAARVAAAGSRTYILTGAFFARSSRPAAPVRAALDAVDHVAVSLDAFHEREVPRESVFRAVHGLLARGRSVSFQVVGRGDGDPYLPGVTEAIRGEFADAVPVLVGRLGRVGRARALPPTGAEPAADGAAAMPCASATWPVVGVDGVVTACANQSVIDRAAPPHLVLGHAARDGWPRIRVRSQETPLLAAIRTVGPRVLLARHGAGVAAPAGYCQSCWALGDRGEVAAAVTAWWARPRGELLAGLVGAAQEAAGPVGFASRYGDRRYAPLVLLGADRPAGRSGAPVAP
jgi:pyruvate-formate lyase-activating enzyme